MIQVIPGSTSDVLNTTTTEYMALWTNEPSTWTATETARRQLVSGNYRFKHLRIFMSAAAGAGTYTFNLRKNLAAAGPTVALANPATTGVDLTNTATFAPGDVATLESVPTGTPINTPQIKWCILCENLDTFNECLIMGGINNTMGTSLAENNSLGGGQSWATNLANNINFQNILAVPGKFKDFYVLLNGAPGAGTNYILTPQFNSGGSGLTVTISGTNTSGNDTTTGSQMIRSDSIDIHENPNSLPTARQAFYSVGFLTDNPHEFQLMGTTKDTLNTTGTPEYNTLNGSGLTWDATEANRSCLMPQCTIHDLIVKIGDTIGVGTSFVFTIYKNGIATTMQATIDSTHSTAEDNTHVVEYSDGDTGSIECVATGAPTGLHDCTWAIVCRKAFYSLSMMGGGI